MFKKIFNDFYIRISSKTLNISEDDFKKMIKEIRQVINKYGVTISVFGNKEEFNNYINREEKVNKWFRKNNSFFNYIKKQISIYKK